MIYHGHPGFQVRLWGGWNELSEPFLNNDLDQKKYDFGGATWQTLLDKDPPNPKKVNKIRGPTQIVI